MNMPIAALLAAFAAAPAAAAPAADSGRDLLLEVTSVSPANGRFQVNMCAKAADQKDKKSCSATPHQTLTADSYECLLKTYGAKDAAELASKSQASPIPWKAGQNSRAAVLARVKSGNCPRLSVDAAELVAVLSRGECFESFQAADLGKELADAPTRDLFARRVAETSGGAYKLSAANEDDFRAVDASPTRSFERGWLLVGKNGAAVGAVETSSDWLICGELDGSKKAPAKK